MLRFFRSLSRSRSQSRDPNSNLDDDGAAWRPSPARQAEDSPLLASATTSRFPNARPRHDRKDHDDSYRGEEISPRFRQAFQARSYFDRQVESQAYQRATAMGVEDEDDNDGDDQDDDHDEGDDEDLRVDDEAEEEEEEEEDDDDDNDDGNEDDVDAPLLPIFSAPHLDRLPLYSITHSIRVLIVQKCETTLSWDQLRSPQISQFLVKPIQSQIRTKHFNRATLCALIANCLQFRKEGHLNPGNVGVSRTRAMMSELLAMRLLREFTTTELIDVLSYDFDPLQGVASPNNEPAPPARNNSTTNSDTNYRRSQGRGARVSTIEIAIRAEAKKLLAHPLVGQHLEAIWSGNVVFHSEADNLHRKSHRQDAARHRATRLHAGIGYGTMESGRAPGSTRKKQGDGPATNDVPNTVQTWARRTATLYNPRDASLFKLSRLRVPRYRQVFSTLSFAGMLALFLAVLVDRSLEITPLEIVFWFWSAGYMLDEVVGFTEQGFGLYILSVWNAFDLGILILFAIYYCLRLYGVLLAEVGQHRIAAVAYDVLASTAILLFPRLFSVLDHYRYFSQLLIAFRLMAQDLLGILILIVISCSGFFVAFTLSFADDKTDASAVAYTLFQIVMGFTPAAWDRWDGYNVLGKAIMAAFLIICHFLIVTILITVLTNSFMAIVKNAEEEHQFLFAINTISMVKSDALFSYVAPTNIIGWLLSPLRFVMPMRQFVKINRTIIKVTHFPILFAIFAYERLVMARLSYAPADLIELPVVRKKPVAFSLNRAPELFSPGVQRLRESSVIGFHKDRALDEVFRRPFMGDTLRTPRDNGDGDPTRSTNVDKWMQVAENEGGASPPLEQPRSVLDRLETRRRPRMRRPMTEDRLRMLQRSREFSTATRSIASDPDVHAASLPGARRPFRIDEEPADPAMLVEPVQETDADGDDEINDESDNVTPAMGESALSLLHGQDSDRAPSEHHPDNDDSESEVFQTPMANKSPLLSQLPSHAPRPRMQDHPSAATSENLAGRKSTHARNTSTGTILFDPQSKYESSASNDLTRTRNQQQHQQLSTRHHAPHPTNLPPPTKRAPKPTTSPLTKPRPPPQARQRTLPITLGPPALTFARLPARRPMTRDPSFTTRALDLASDIGDNQYRVGGSGLNAGLLDASGSILGMAASFNEQLMRARGLPHRFEMEEKRRRSAAAQAELDEEKGRVNRIMLARMNTLEEGFREVLREIKDMSRAASTRRESEVETGSEKLFPGFPKVTSSSAASTTNPPYGSGANHSSSRNIYNPTIARARLEGQTGLGSGGSSLGTGSGSNAYAHKLAPTGKSPTDPSTGRPKTARRNTKRERDARREFAAFTAQLRERDDSGDIDSSPIHGPDEFRFPPPATSLPDFQLQEEQQLAHSPASVGSVIAFGGGADPSASVAAAPMALATRTGAGEDGGVARSDETQGVGARMEGWTPDRDDGV